MSEDINKEIQVKEPEIETKIKKEKKKKTSYLPVVVFLFLWFIDIFITFLFFPSQGYYWLNAGSLIFHVIILIIVFLLCKYHHNGIAWIIIFLPLILSIFIVIFAVLLGFTLAVFKVL